MRHAPISRWAAALETGPDDVAERLHQLEVLTGTSEEAARHLRDLVHELPDRDIDEACMKAELALGRAAELLGYARREAQREVG